MEQNMINKISVLILLIFYHANDSNGLKILGIFPFNGKSHSVIEIEVMKGLAAKGHQVDVYSHYPLKKPIPNYTDFSLAGTIPTYNMTYDVVKDQRIFNMPELLRLVGKPVCELMDLPIFQKLLRNPPKYDLFITEVKTSFDTRKF